MTAGGTTTDGPQSGQPEPAAGADVAVPRVLLEHSGGRRLKAALFVWVCGAAGMAPHWLPPSRGVIPAVMLAVVLGGYAIRTVLLESWARLRQSPHPSTSPPADSTLASWPLVDIVVAARDEQAVIVRLVERIAKVRYPEGRLTLWVIDDGSEDRTPELLAELQSRWTMLRVLRRPRDAGGGKSGALNLVLQQLQGTWLLVLDADAGLPADGLERLLPMAEAGGWAAVQLRKAVVNSTANWLTRAQAMEMAFDATIQESRLAVGGITELRGNGQLLRRDAVLACGGFNEATVTDDLDLSFRLLLLDQPIGVLWDPPVEEEAVLTLAALWRQRQRWAEGGLQRYFDYWPGLVSGPLSTRQKLDLGCFFVLQYAMPVMAAADLIGVLLTATPPLMWPVSIVALGLSGLAIGLGCSRPVEGPPLPVITPVTMGWAIVYLMHWFVVIPWVSLRMALLPKRLIWAKTQHVGGADDPLEADPELAAGGGQA